MSFNLNFENDKKQEITQLETTKEKLKDTKSKYNDRKDSFILKTCACAVLTIFSILFMNMIPFLFEVGLFAALGSLGCLTTSVVYSIKKNKADKELRQVKEKLADVKKALNNDLEDKHIEYSLDYDENIKNINRKVLRNNKTDKKDKEEEMTK